MSEPGSPTRSGRPRWWLIAGAVVLASVAAWFVLATQARGDVRVLPRAMHCEKDVPYRLIAEESGDDPPFIGFDVTLRRNSFCQLEITIVNDGSRAVHVSTATFPTMGQIGSGFPFEITQNGGRFNAEDSGSNDEGDAVLPIDETIEGGESIDVLLDLRARKSGFVGDPNRTIGLSGIPLVRVSSAGLPGTVTGSVDLRIREKK